MRFTLIILIALTSEIIFSQTGGEHVFPFLDLDYNARSSALGRYNIAIKDKDVNVGVNNPSLLNEEMNNTIGFNQALLAAGINHGMVAYATKIEDYGVASAHLRYVAYGIMDRTDVNGEVIGTFSAGDFILGGGFGSQLNPRISVGGNVNLIWSQLESYTSIGMSIDLAGTYINENERTTISAVVRNAVINLKLIPKMIELHYLQMQ